MTGRVGMALPDEEPSPGAGPLAGSAPGAGPWILLDTNLIVALWLQDPRLQDMALALERGGLKVATATFLLEEALDVLMRPAIRRERGYGLSDVQQWLQTRFAAAPHRSVPMQAPPAPRAPDPGDQFLWDLLAAHPDLVLWTRDKRLLRDRGMRGRVMEPKVLAEGAQPPSEGRWPAQWHASPHDIHPIP